MKMFFEATSQGTRCDFQIILNSLAVSGDFMIHNKHIRAQNQFKQAQIQAANSHNRPISVQLGLNHYPVLMDCYLSCGILSHFSLPTVDAYLQATLQPTSTPASCFHAVSNLISAVGFDVCCVLCWVLLLFVAATPGLTELLKLNLSIRIEGFK